MQSPSQSDGGNFLPKVMVIFLIRGAKMPLGRFELPTSRLLSARSDQLSYRGRPHEGRCGKPGYRSWCLSHAKRALCHLSKFQVRSRDDCYWVLKKPSCNVLHECDLVLFCMNLTLCDNNIWKLSNCRHAKSILFNQIRYDTIPNLEKIRFQ